MHPAILSIEKSHRKITIAPVQSGDTVRVHQRIKEGAKERVQVFEGVVIRTHRPGELTACVTVRRIASGVGVEKTFLLHSPNISKIEILRRARVRRNFLSYLRARRGKSARLQELAFDKVAANTVATASPDQEEIDELADQQATEMDVDATQSAPIDESTDVIAAEENDVADAADQTTSDDEQELAADEHQSGVDKANDEAKQ